MQADTNNSKEIGVFRQGDILITAVQEIPEGLKEVPRENGRVVVAHGERTGHFHALEDPQTMLLAADLQEMTDRFLRVESDALVHAWECRTRRRMTCYVPTYVERERVEAAPDIERIVGESDVRGAILTHDEHLHFVVPNGMHKVTRQREYAPEAPIQVAD